MDRDSPTADRTSAAHLHSASARSVRRTEPAILDVDAIWRETPAIRIHNSLTGEKQALKPITSGEVNLYVCGLTAYDFMHIGHARMMTVFDVVCRYLRHRGYRVTYVRNITDIDDKIIRRAAENGESTDALTRRMIQAMNEDCAQLGLLPPDFEPRATRYVPDIIAMISTLFAKGYAYVATNGDVMYSVANFHGYGTLSGKRLADLRAGARVQVNDAKRDPLDFVLWKQAKSGDPSWYSPWGRGRPGWHIECSAMSTALLGAHFDIHGGGMDLKFPHHENEIAQCCAASGEPFANLWMHNGFVHLANEKMSKSLSNFIAVRDVLPKLPNPEVLRYLILESHYRAPLNFSLEHLERAGGALCRLYTALRDVPVAPVAASEFTMQFLNVMDDDFHTPQALAVLQTLTRRLNSAKSAGRSKRVSELAAELRSLASILGLITMNPEKWFRRIEDLRVSFRHDASKQAMTGTNETSAISPTQCTILRQR